MLAEAQERLDEHFLSLSRERADLGYPVYALEHGLDPSGILALRTALANALAHDGALSRAYWLPWIVVAAEIGYDYDGDEYWDSFARAIPNWRAYGNRTTIRTWFDAFAKRYGGFRPSGRWAQHFSIIAWPIAHAILPRDLQGQFARHLYDLRYELARRPGVPIGELGSIIRAGDPAGSSRFQHLLDQTELTARLVLALRDEDVLDAVPAIHRPTLARIVADLERRQSARDWLKEARTVLREARMRASAALSRRGGGTATREDAEPERGNGARLVARQSAEGAWVLGVSLPDLAQIVRQAGLDPKTLDQTRFRLGDHTSRWMPGRGLLTLAKTEQRIRSLVQLASQSILYFERDIPCLSGLLAGAARIKGNSPWLLRIQEDGVARQLIGNYVRAGQNYLIVSEIELAPEIVHVLKLQAVAAGVEDGTVYILRIPRTLGANELKALDAIKIGHRLCANIEPMGLVPRWDGAAGCSVWLTTEELLLRLSADHPVQEFSVSVDGCPVVRIPVGNLPEAIVSLGCLPAGPHVIEVGALTKGAQGGQLEPERLDIDVRTPLPWRQGVRQQAGFRAIREPDDASLDNILDGKARLAIVGPPERAVAVDVKLFNLSGQPTERIPLGRVASLADEPALRRLLAKLAQGTRAEEIHSAPRVDLAFAVDELGVDTLSFFHKVRPLRWRLEVEDRAYSVRLIDEAGADHAVTIKQFNVSRPDVGVDVDYDQCLGGCAVAAPGALFVATSEKKPFSAIVSVPPQRDRIALTDLGAAVTVSPSLDGPKHIPRLLALLRLWSRAHQVLGPIGMVRKAEVCAAFEQRVAAIVCGTDWARRVWQCRATQVPSLDQLQREIGASPGFGSRLKSTDWRQAIGDGSAPTAFAHFAEVYRVSSDPELCALALQLALSPATVKFDTPDKGVPSWERLAQVPALAKGAFFVQLVVGLAINTVPTTEMVCA